MDTSLLDYFLRVAELGSINKAAIALNLSQPALSRYIAAIEEDMEVTLFNRSQRGVSLTEAGQLLANRSRPLLRQFATLKEQVGEKAAGQLSFGVSPALHHVFCSPFVIALIQRCPSVALRVYEDVSHVLRDHMVGGLLDLCIAPFDASLTTGFKQTALVREPLVLVGAPKDGFDPRTPLSASILDGKKLVLPGKPNVLRSQVERILGRKGLKFHLGVESDTLALCMDFAKMGIGYSVVPSSAVCDPSLGSSVTWAPVRGLYLTWALYENLGRGHSLPVREGVRLVSSTLAKSVKTGEWHGAELLNSSAP